MLRYLNSLNSFILQNLFCGKKRLRSNDAKTKLIEDGIRKNIAMSSDIEQINLLIECEKDTLDLISNVIKSEVHIKDILALRNSNEELLDSDFNLYKKLQKFCSDKDDLNSYPVIRMDNFKKLIL